MSYAVAIAAFRELLDHTCRMRYAVAVCTLLYGFVFIRMTSRTGKVVVFRCVCLKQGHCILMASAAIMRRGLRRVGDYERHMNWMAGLAGLKVHVCGVFVVTIHANGDYPVPCVTLVTWQIRVSTGMILYFLALLCVTGEARSGKFALQGNIQGGMRVGMAASAVLQFIMGFVSMTHAALWNSTGSCGRMFNVAVLTSNFGLVFGPFFCNRLRLLRVTIAALRISYRLKCPSGFRLCGR